jgi:hypothetical protein
MRHTNNNNNERRLVTESPDTHTGQSMQAFIAREASRPSKQWIHEVLSAKREADRVKLRTSTFVLLPDVDCITKRAKRQEKTHEVKEPPVFPVTNPLYFWQGVSAGRFFRRPTHQNSHQNSTPAFHWLAVVTDTSLRTIRDLRGEHVPMLQALHAQSCQKIFEEYGVHASQVLAYLHYPPSVYQLHIHFKHLSGHNAFHDTFRVHPLLSIINNLKIDSEFYKRSHLQLPVYVHTDLYQALLEKNSDKTGESPEETLLGTSLGTASSLEVSSENETHQTSHECYTETSPGSTPSTPGATDGKPMSFPMPNDAA